MYGDKETIQSLCMMPVVLSTTYGEKEASLQLTKAWELLGGKPCDGIEAYITDPEDFKANDGYTTFVEKKSRAILPHLYRQAGDIAFQ